MTDRAWFRRLLRHSARKCSGSILTTPEPARGIWDGWGTNKRAITIFGAFQINHLPQIPPHNSLRCVTNKNDLEALKVSDRLSTTGKIFEFLQVWTLATPLSGS